MLALLAAALCVLALASLPPRLLSAQPTGLLADPLYTGQPLFQSEEREGLRLLVYRAEAVPGATTVWWELRGPGAGQMAGVAAKSLTLHYAGEATVETMVHRKDRLLGRSVFPILNPGEQTELHLSTGPDRQQVIPIRLTMLEQDPAARTIEVGGEVDIGTNYYGSPPGDYRIAIDRVRIGERATTITLRFTDLQTLRFPDVMVDGRPLARAGVWTPTRRELEYELVLHPVPPDARQLTLTFQLGRIEGAEELIRLPAPDFFLEWKEEEGLLTALFPASVAPGYSPSLSLATRDGRYVPAQIERVQPGLWKLSSELLTWQLGNGWSNQLVKVEPAELAELRLYIPRLVPDPSLTIELR